MRNFFKRYVRLPVILLALSFATSAAYAFPVTVLDDTFEAGSLEAWTVSGPAEEENGALVLDVDSASNTNASAILQDGNVSDFTMEAQFQVEEWFSDSWLPFIGFYLKYTDVNNCYWVKFGPQEGGAYEVSLRKAQGTWQGVELASAIIERPAAGGSHTVRIEAQDNTISVYLDDTGLLTYTDAGQPLVNGKVGVTSYLQKVRFDRITITCEEEAGWSPMVTDPAVVPGSAMDLSFLQERPAGKYGFVKIDGNGNYYFENRPGQTVKFYGTNSVGSWSGGDPTKEEAVQIADRIAAMGYNLVRFHANDLMESWANGIYNQPTSDVITLNEQKLDVLDYMIFLLKERGIYINVDIVAYANFDQVPGLSGYGLSAAQLAVLFDDGMALWKQMAQTWLEHVNPYTGLALKDDPVLVGISPWNESLLYNYNSMTSKLSQWYLEDINRYLSDKGEAPLDSIPQSFWSASGRTADVLVEYFTHKTVTAYREMKRYLQQDIGVKAPIGGFNHINDSLATSWRTEADIHETHLYNGLVDGRNKSFSYTPSAHVRYSMAFDEQANMDLRNYIPFLAVGQLYHKPFALTEFNQEFPTAGRDELGLITAAVGEMNGWDIYNRFDFTTMVKQAVSDSPLGGFTSFDTVSDPLVAASEYQANLLVQRGNVTEAPLRFVIVRDKSWTQTHGASVYTDWDDLDMAYLPHLFQMATVYVDQAEQPFAVYKVTPDLTPEQIASGAIPESNRLPLADGMTKKEVAQTFINALDDTGQKEKMLDYLGQDKLLSETGELLFDMSANTFMVQTPYMVGAAGTLDGQVLELGGVTLRGDIQKGTMTVSALDGKPIAQSGRLLALYTTDVKAASEKQVENGGSVTYYRGALPTLVKQATGEIAVTVEGQPSSYAAYRLDMNGNRLERLDITIEGNTLHIPLSVDSGFGFEIVQDGFRFAQDGMPVTDMAQLTGGGHVTAAAELSAAEGPYLLAMALYRQGDLQSAVCKQVADAAGAQIDMVLPKQQMEEYQIKAFLWDETLQPVIANGVLE